MTTAINLDELSIDELHQLVKDAEKAIERRKQTQAKQALEEVKKLASARGFDLDDLIAMMHGNQSGSAKKVTTKAPPKYRDPANPDNTWSGRGKPPKWMDAAVKGGKSKADFLIAD